MVEELKILASELLQAYESCYLTHVYCAILCQITYYENRRCVMTNNKIKPQKQTSAIKNMVIILPFVSVNIMLKKKTFIPLPYKISTRSAKNLFLPFYAFDYFLHFFPFFSANFLFLIWQCFIIIYYEVLCLHQPKQLFRDAFRTRSNN